MNNSMFVACPIGSEGSPERIRSNKLFEHFISPISSSVSMNPIRVDLLNNPGKITDDIINYLENSKIAIIDITGANPNVFFELGYRFKTGKPFVIIKHVSDTSNIPFDISSIRVFNYSFDITEVDALREKITEAILNADYSNTRILASGPESDLVVTAHEAPDGPRGFSFNVRNKNK